MHLRDSNDPGAPLYEIRVVVLKRRTKETFAAYGTNMPVEEFDNAQLMDAYFQRWPAQELIFRELNSGAHFKTIHGYGKQRVRNVTVLDQITTLSTQIENATRRLEQAKEQMEERARALRELNTGAKKPKTTQANRLEIENRTLKIKLAQSQHKERVSEVRRLEDQIERKRREREVLETRREIYQCDVELDQILSVLKLGCALLVQTVLHRYFDGLAIEFNTFINQICALSGTRLRTDSTETIVFRANRRNRALMEQLERACDRFNATNHQRAGRTVRFEVAWPGHVEGHAT